MSATTIRAIAVDYGGITSPASVCLLGDEPGKPEDANRAFPPSGRVASMNHRAATRIASVSSRHPAGTAAYCFAAMDEAGDYERADAPAGGTVWDVARALAPAAIVLRGCRRAAIVDTASRAGASGFPAGWDEDVIIDAVLAVGRDPDRITWDPAAWPGGDITRLPGWRAEGTVAGVTITVALREDGEITGAWPDEGPGADGNLGAAGPTTSQPAYPPKTPGSMKGEA